MVVHALRQPVDPPAAAARSPEEWFHERATHYVEAQVLFALNRVGVFQLLDDGRARTIDEMAHELSLDRHTLECCIEYTHGVDALLEVDEADRYTLTVFGRRVLDRYGREDPDGRVFNFFDVRVGSYGPVWGALEPMLRGDASYGAEVHRAGAHAAVGVYKVAPHLLPGLAKVVGELGIRRVVEVGVPTGLLARAKAALPHLEGVGLDRDRDALVDAEARAAELGATGLTWVRGDFFDPDSWVDRVAGPGPGALATIHFHELIADGGEALQAALRRLRQRLPGWYVIAFEQERLTEADRHRVPPQVWSYSHSNVMIHHLIRNGRVLSREGWTRMFTDAGCRVERVEPLGYLGYHIYVFQL